MNKVFKKVVYIVFGLFILSLLISCPNTVIEKKDNTGELYFELPSRNINNELSKNHLIFYVKVTSSSANYNYENKIGEGEAVKLQNLRPGNYKIYLEGEDQDFIYKSTQNIYLELGQHLNLNINFEPIQKGGQISLFFKGISFDNNLSFNLSVKDDNDKEVFSKNKIPVTEIINNIYTIPTHFPAGNYYVSLTGGDIEKEQYVVNNNKFVAVEQGKSIKYDVDGKPYKIVYVNGNKIGSTADSGSEQNPTHSLISAFNKVKDFKDPVKIIITGEVFVDIPLVLEEGLNITFQGANGAKLKSTGCEIIKINGANVTLKDIELFNEDRGTNTVIYNNGNLFIDSNVYIKDIFMNNNVITLNKPLITKKNKYTTIILNEYKEDMKLFNLCLSSDFDSSNIKTGNPDFRVDNRGYCQRVLKTLSVKITNIEDTSGMINKDLSYKIISDNAEIVPDTALKCNTVFTVPDLKAGIPYTVEVYSKYTSKENKDKSGIPFNKPGYIRCSSRTITLHPEYDDRNSLDMDLRRFGKNITGCINFTSPATEVPITYPLTVLLIGTNGNIIKENITGRAGCYINYIPADVYTVNISNQNIKERFVVSNQVTVTQNKITDCTFDFSIREPAIYYVDQHYSASANSGTKENPFLSLSDAIDRLNNFNEPATIILETDVRSGTKIIIDKPLNFTIVGKGSSTVLNFDNGLFDINNKDADITLKNIWVKSETLPANDTENLIALKQGHLSLLGDVKLQYMPSMPDPSIEIPLTSLIEVAPTGILDVTDGFYTVNGYVLLDDDAKIRLLNAFTEQSEIAVNIKSKAPRDNLQIIVSANQDDDNILKECLSKRWSCIKCVNSGFGINENGFLSSTADYLRVNDLDEISTKINSYIEQSAYINLYIETQEEFALLGKKLRAFPLNSIEINLKVSPSITSIDKNSFNFDSQGCQSLRYLTIESPIKSIGDYAFENCSNLTNVNLPASLETIGEAAFRKCPCFTSVTIPVNVKLIKANAFANQELEEVIFEGPDSNWTLLKTTGEQETFATSSPFQNARQLQIIDTEWRRN